VRPFGRMLLSGVRRGLVGVIVAFLGQKKQKGKKKKDQELMNSSPVVQSGVSRKFRLRMYGRNALNALLCRPKIYNIIKKRGRGAQSIGVIV
jgi:hypothetical protein